MRHFLRFAETRPVLAALFGSVFVIAAAPAPARALPLAADHGCIGRWVGEGRNTGSPTSWTIDLTLAAAPSGGRCGTIEYTNPTCGGTLESCNVVGGDIHTQEVYSHNDGRCAPAGRVIIRCEGDRMRYSWIGWERVDSVLHRPGGSPPSGGTAPTPGIGPAPPTVPRPGVPAQPPSPAPMPGPPGPVPPRPPGTRGAGDPPARGGGLCAVASPASELGWVCGPFGLAIALALGRRGRARARRA